MHKNAPDTTANLRKMAEKKRRSVAEKEASTSRSGAFPGWTSPPPGKALQNDRVCYRCTQPIIEPETIFCPNCHSSDIDERRARPELNLLPRRIGVQLPFPWEQLDFRAGGTALLSGNRGSGKTTISVAARPSIIDTSEQEISQVADTWKRIHGMGAKAPLIANCSSWEQLESDIDILEVDQLFLLDSVSQLAHGFETSTIVARCIEKIRKKQARAIFICQYTKDGGILGPNELQHLVDVVLEIPPDKKSGARRLVARKNRFGSLFTTYFTIGARGPIPISFDYAYSIEGSAGDYSLHLYPMGGAEWSGLLEALEETRIDLRGLASAAIRSSAYRSGFALPPDNEERKRFAEAHGLTYVTPENFDAIVQERQTAQQEPLTL